MSDSNPRSGDWGNITNGCIVYAVGVILLGILVVLFVTGHGIIAGLVLAILLIIAALVVVAGRGARQERDH